MLEKKKNLHFQLVKSLINLFYLMKKLQLSLMLLIVCGNKFYEVPFLAQDTIFEDEENTSLNDPELSEFKNDTPYLLKLIKSSRRFTTRVRDDNKMELRFGSGVSDNADEEIIPNPDNVGSRLGFGVSRLDESFDPSNFLKTKHLD